MAWTDERIERLKVLWADGYSASQIAAELGGITRNAVIGKVHRLGLTLRGARAQPTRKPRAPYTPRKPIARARVATSAAEAKPHYLDAIEPADAPTPDDVSPFACTLLELTEDTCRFPLGDPAHPEFRFCGAKPHLKLPYCPAHCAVAFEGPPIRRTAAEREERAIQARANLMKHKRAVGVAA